MSLVCVWVQVLNGMAGGNQYACGCRCGVCICRRRVHINCNYLQKWTQLLYIATADTTATADVLSFKRIKIAYHNPSSYLT